MKQIPIHFITGFLGSGKTTFLSHLLNVGFEGKRIAIIQNEFAPANIDGATLKQTVNRDFELLEINNGSIFCVCLLSGFMSSLQKFTELHRPDIILIETSGMSDPIAIGELFNGDHGLPYYLSSVICVVDAVNFKKFFSIIPQTKRQIMVANMVVINKTDLNRGEVESIHQIVQSINPFAKRFETTYCQLPLDELLKDDEVYQPGSDHAMEPLNTGQSTLKSAVIKTSKPVDVRQMQRFLDELSAQCYRVKGFVYGSDDQLYSVQVVMQQVDYKMIALPVKRTELIAIGENMSVRVLKSVYDRYLASTVVQ